MLQAWAGTAPPGVFKVKGEVCVWVLSSQYAASVVEEVPVSGAGWNKWYNKVIFNAKWFNWPVFRKYV